MLGISARNGRAGRDTFTPITSSLRKMAANTRRATFGLFAKFAVRRNTPLWCNWIAHGSSKAVSVGSSPTGGTFILIVAWNDTSLVLRGGAIPCLGLGGLRCPGSHDTWLQTVALPGLKSCVIGLGFKPRMGRQSVACGRQPQVSNHRPNSLNPNTEWPCVVGRAFLPAAWRFDRQECLPHQYQRCQFWPREA